MRNSARSTAPIAPTNREHTRSNAQTLSRVEVPTSLGDALEEASCWLRQAVAIPYESADSARWAREFQPMVAAVRRLLATRGAALREGAGLPPRLRAWAAREADDHEHVTRMADELFTDAYMATEPDTLEMVDLIESAKELQRAIERLRERRSDLLFEATYRELGGG